MIDVAGFVLFFYLPLGILGIACMVALFIKVHTWDKEDNKWYAYNNAYKRWERNGKVGEMPQLEDY